MKLSTLAPNELTLILGAIALLLLCAFIFGRIFVALKAPKVVGEICGGFFISAILTKIAPEHINILFSGFSEEGKALDTFYHLGLIFLMFMAGFNTRLNYARQNLNIIILLFVGATVLPISIGYFFIDIFKDAFIGSKANDLAFALVFLIGIAVTSIPVISKIFFDLGLINTRFAGIVLSTATAQDLFLWILLNIAINSTLDSTQNLLYSNLFTAILTIVLFFGINFVAKICKIIKNKLNMHFSNEAFYLMLFLTLFVTICILSLAKINPMYSAFLCGFLVKNISEENPEIKSISDFSFSFFIPIYFALIGLSLNITKEFALMAFLGFFVLACMLEFGGVYLILLLTKMKNISRVNFALTMNARGGPGIVLASVGAYYEIINADFFTTLIITTLLSSMFAGYFLRYIKSKNMEVFESF